MSPTTPIRLPWPDHADRPSVATDTDDERRARGTMQAMPAPAPIRFRQADVVVPDPRLAHRNLRHDWHELNLVIEGIYLATVDGVEWSCDPGTAVVLPAGWPHRPSYRRDRSVKLLNLQWIGGNWPNTALTIDDSDRRLTQAIRWLIDRNPIDSDERRRFADHLVNAIILDCRRLARRPRDDLAERIRTYLHERMHQALSLEEVARTFGLSRRRIGEIFRQRFGQPPMAYLADLRADAAAAMLRDSDASVSAIAERLGWTDRGHLSRLIKRRFGCSPSQLRRGA